MSIRKYAIIENSTVVNTILWDDAEEYSVFEGQTLFESPDEISIGWSVLNDEWVAPPPPPAQVIPQEDPEVLLAKQTAATQLIALGISEAIARTIVGLPPIE